MIRTIVMTSRFIWISFLYSVLILLLENRISITVEAIAWMRKYFSMFSFWDSHIIMDIIKDIEVNSSKIQIINQELDDTANIGGVNNIIITKFFFINKKCFAYL